MKPDVRQALRRYGFKELCYFLSKLGIKSAQAAGLSSGPIYIDDGAGGLIVAQPGMNAKVINVRP